MCVAVDLPQSIIYRQCLLPREEGVRILEYQFQYCEHGLWIVWTLSSWCYNLFKKSCLSLEKPFAVVREGMP